MALIPDWTGSFDAEPPYSEFRTYAGATTSDCSGLHRTLAQVMARDSAQKVHGSYGCRVNLIAGDFINCSPTVNGLDLYGPQNVANGTEEWYGWAYRFVPGGIISTSWNTVSELGVGFHITHPSYMNMAFQTPLVSGQLQLRLGIQTGHKSGPGASDFHPTPPNGYEASEPLLGPGAPQALTLNVWHYFYWHVVWSAYHGLTAGQIDAPGAHTILPGVLEIWHREGAAGAWGKLYSNLNNGTALINRAPHPTLQWNSQYGASGENGTPLGTRWVGFYRAAQSVTDTYYVDGNFIRQSEAEILSEFGQVAPPIPEPPAPAANHLRIGNASPTSGLTSTADPDFKRVLKRGVGAGNSVACDRGYAYLTGPSSGGSQPLRMIVHDDDAGGGLPGSLKGVSDEVVLAQGASVAWVNFPFSTPAQITGDQLYFGLISGQGGTSLYGYQDVAGGAYRLGDSYADGPSNPFGANPLVLAIEPGFVLDYTVSGDEIAPVFVSATVQSTLLSIQYNETLNTTAPTSAAFAVTVNQQPWSLVPMVSVVGSQVLLTLAAPVVYEDIVMVAYTQPGTNDIQDVAGNKAASFAAQTVSNNTETIGVRRIDPSARVAVARRIDPSARRAGEGGGL